MISNELKHDETNHAMDKKKSHKRVKVTDEQAKLIKGQKKKKHVHKKVKTPEEKQEQKLRQMEAQKKRREQERQKKKNNMVAADDTVIKQEPKKRGRKSGRKKTDQEFLLKPEKVLEYMIRNYPSLGIDKIRDQIIIGLKEMKTIEEEPYRLYKFRYNGNDYYCDEKFAIYNTDAKVVGYFVKRPNDSKKMYMIDSKDKDTRTFQEVIDSIEKQNDAPVELTTKEQPECELYKFRHNNNEYYCDDKCAIYDTDLNIVGYFVNQPNDVKKIYMIDSQNTDNRSFQEIIDSIENPI